MAAPEISLGTVVTRPEDVRPRVERIIAATPAVDMHTHLFPPQFGELFQCGIDELLTYHYLVAELFRASDITPERYWELPRAAQAEHVWEALFVRSTPLSESARGVLAVLAAFGLDPAAADLRESREFFRALDPDEHVERVLAAAGVKSVVMTNDPFDAAEASAWRGGIRVHPRFRAALRLDTLLHDWSRARPRLRAEGWKLSEALDAPTIAELRRFLDEWIGRMRPMYLAVSLPDTFAWSEESDRVRLMQNLVLPACREHRLPFAMMIGVRRGANPALRGAGDSVGRADIRAVEQMCREHPDNRFLVSMLSRENQHELCVAARKFANLLPFGCWWFLNVPSLVREITSQRLELLGPTFVAQHSDARILEQLIYKWSHARRDVGAALAEQYVRVLEAGRSVTVAEMQRDVSRLLEDNFLRWSQADGAANR